MRRGGTCWACEPAIRADDAGDRPPSRAPPLVKSITCSGAAEALICAPAAAAAATETLAPSAALAATSGDVLVTAREISPRSRARFSSASRSYASRGGRAAPATSSAERSCWDSPAGEGGEATWQGGTGGQGGEGRAARRRWGASKKGNGGWCSGEGCGASCQRDRRAHGGASCQRDRRAHGGGGGPRCSMGGRRCRSLT